MKFAQSKPTKKVNLFFMFLKDDENRTYVDVEDVCRAVDQIFEGPTWKPIADSFRHSLHEAARKAYEKAT